MATHAIVSDRRRVLDGFARALRREAHNLTGRPDLLWQQLYNRLQWEEGPSRVLGSESETRGWADRGLWLRSRSRFRESASLIRVVRAFSGIAIACEVGVDGSTILAVGCEERESSIDGREIRTWGVRIWDTSTGQQQGEFGSSVYEDEGFAASPDGRTVALAKTCCAFSPDGSFVVSPGGVELWDRRTGEELATLALAVRERLTPQEREAEKGRLMVWDVFSGRELTVLEGHTGEVKGCAVGPDGRRVASVGTDPTVRIWDAGTGEEIACLRAPGHSNACAFSPDGSLLVEAVDSNLRVWEVESGRERMTLTGHSGLVADCAVSPDASFALSAGWDGTLRVWDLETGKTRAVLVGHSFDVNGCAISPDGSTLVSASFDRTLRLWDAREATLETLPGGHSNSVEACAFSPDGSRILSAGKDGWVKAWDPETGDEAWSCEAHEYGVNHCAIRPDGKVVASAGGDWILRLWDVERGEEVVTLEGHEGEVTWCGFSPDGSRLFSAGSDDSLRAWDSVAGWKSTTFAGHTDQVNGCAVSLDGSLVVSASGGHLRSADDPAQDNAVRLWDGWTGEPLAVLPGHYGAVVRVALSPDESFILSASEDGTLKLWETATGVERATLQGHGGEVDDCAIHPDGETVVSAGRDGTLRLWSSKTGEETEVLAGHSQGVVACAVSPDGASVFSADAGGELRIWCARTGRERASLFLPGDLTCLAVHPSQPVVACGDMSGAVYVVELVGAAYGPLYVTAVDRGEGPTVRCPACQTQSPLSPEYLGAQAHCPKPDCDVEWRVNPFVIGCEQRVACRVISSLARAGPKVRSGHDGEVTALAITPDGDRVISGAKDGTVRVWQLPSGVELLQRFDDFEDPVGDLAVCSDGERVVAVAGKCEQAKIVIWDLDSGEALKKIIVGADPTRCGALTSDARQAIFVEEKGLFVVDVEEKAFVRGLSLDMSAVHTVDVSSDGRWLVFGSGDEFNVGDLSEPAGQVGVLRAACNLPVTAVAITDDGSRAVYGDLNGFIVVWDVQRRTRLHVFRGHGSTVTQIMPTRSGRFITVSLDGTLNTWDFATGELVENRKVAGGILVFRYTPDGKWLIAGDQAGRVHILPA